jgi:hypothetical protein
MLDRWPIHLNSAKGCGDSASIAWGVKLVDDDLMGETQEVIAISLEGREE